MANPFYTKTFDVTPGNLVRSQTLEDQFLLVEQGFDNVNTNLVTKASPTTTGTGSHTGDYTITGNETVTGGLSVGGSETVTGGMSVGTSLTVGGSETVTGGLSVGGAITAGGKVTAGAGPSTSLDLTTKDYVDSLVTATAFSSALPTQSGNAGKFVTTNGTSASWAAAGISQITTATGNTTLTNTSTLLQITPTGYGVTVTLPDATTCSVGGPLHCIDNRSQYHIRVVDSTGALKNFVFGNTTVYTMLDNNSTAAGVWAFSSYQPVGVSASTATTSFGSITGVVDLGSGRELLLGTAPSTGNAMGMVYDRATNTFGSATLIRTASTGNFPARGILVAANSVLVVTCTSTTAMEGVVLSISGTTITVNTAGTLTIAGNVSDGYFSGPTLVQVGSSYVLGYATVAPQCYAVAITVSGTTVTFGTPATLAGSGTNTTMQVSGSVVMIAVTLTTNLYVSPYTVSGTTMTLGTGVTISGGTMAINYFFPLGSRWCLIYGDGGTATGAVVTLSGTTVTRSSISLGLTNSALSAAIISSSKVLVTSSSSTAGANILTDTAGTPSVGTALTLADATSRFLYFVGSVAVVAGSTNPMAQYIDCSGASPTFVSSARFPGSTTISTTIVNTRSSTLQNHQDAVFGSGACYTLERFLGGSAVFWSAFVGLSIRTVGPGFQAGLIGSNCRGLTDAERWVRGGANGDVVSKVECVA